MPELSYCGEQVRRNDPDRFVTAMFAPADRREDLFALYAFNSEISRIRDSVTEPMMGHIRLQWWRDALDRLERGELRHHPVADTLGTVISRRGLKRKLIDQLIDAREFDLENRAPATMGELKRYVEQSSANLVLLALQTLGADSGAAHLAGRHIGMVWALTGLLRAVPVHARAGRLYLPADLVERAGLSVGQIAVGGGAALAGIAEIVAGVAGDYLGHARSQGRVDRKALPALLLAALAEGHLRRLARAGYDLHDAKFSAPDPLRAARLWWRIKRGRF